MALQYPQINGLRPDWGQVRVKAKGQVYLGVVAVNYKSPLKPTKVRGTHPSPIARTRGQEEPDGDVEMLADEAKALQEALGPGYKEVPFDIEVSYTMADQSIQTDELIGCRIIDIEAGHSQGTDALTKKIPLDIMKVLINGLEALTSPLQGSPGGNP